MTDSVSSLLRKWLLITETAASFHSFPPSGLEVFSFQSSFAREPVSSVQAPVCSGFSVCTWNGVLQSLGFLFPCILFVICRCSILGLVYKLTFMKRTKTELAKQMGVATIDLKDDVLLVL